MDDRAPEMRQALDTTRSRTSLLPVCQASPLHLGTGRRLFPDEQLIVFARDDDYFFGVLHSRIHEVWALRMGTSLERAAALHPHHHLRDLPLPLAARPGAGGRSACPGHRRGGSRPGGEARRVAQSNRRIGTPKRKQRTLTNLYNARPAWLDLAHRALDAAVLAAYGWPKDLTDDEILARLLALNLERAGKQRG